MIARATIHSGAYADKECIVCGGVSTHYAQVITTGDSGKEIILDIQCCGERDHQAVAKSWAEIEAYLLESGDGHLRWQSAQARSRPSVMELTSDNFDAEVLQSDLPVLVLFYAGPLQMMHPVVDQLAQRYAGRVKVFKVDLDVSPDLRRRNVTRAIPSTLIFSGGELVDWDLNCAPEDILARRLDSLLVA